MLRWGLQHGRSVIPKSTKPSRIAENINVFDFELSADDMAAIDGLDTGRRGGPEPDAITLEASAARSRRPESRCIAELAVRTLTRTYELASLVRVRLSRASPQGAESVRPHHRPRVR